MFPLYLKSEKNMPSTRLNPLRRWILALAVAAALPVTANAAEPELLNVSYDVARELYKDINPAFVESWKKSTGETVTIKQSHGGSSKQARAVADGLEAAVVTMNQANDIDMLADRGLVAKDWARKFPNNAAPYYSTMVYLVRKGTLDEFVYLEHGAHYAIGILAVIMLASMKFHVPELVTGLTGVAFIVASLWSSIQYKKKHALLEAHEGAKELA